MDEKSMTPEAIAATCAQVMWEKDTVANHLGMELLSISPGKASLSMTVQDFMINGHGTCHGGYIFTFADSAFAYACNGYNQFTVGQHCAISYINPAYSGDVLVATADERMRSGRNGMYDISITNQNGELIAEFRGNSRTVKGTHIEL